MAPCWTQEMVATYSARRFKLSKICHWYLQTIFTVALRNRRYFLFRRQPPFDVQQQNAVPHNTYYYILKRQPVLNSQRTSVLIQNNFRIVSVSVLKLQKRSSHRFFNSFYYVYYAGAKCQQLEPKNESQFCRYNLL